ncbi:glycosyltransferase family 2 protein [Marinilabilia sp.]|uniref:glycosyltransferase family 2 protein n=1 Tax=Marinilabilia sp. TaxID=2021252 RepID=UPI0025BD83A6|nr:glycosyltransferase family 2 protein [Marinilabilia sp.]
MGSISLIIPAYNVENFIEQAIKSAFLPQVNEILVIDDKYPDNAIYKVSKIVPPQHIKIKILNHPDNKNHGAAASRNLGIKHASSKYIAFLDGDDIFYQNRFTDQIKFLAKNSKFDGCYGSIDFFLDDNSLANQVNAHTTGIKEDITSEQLFETLLTGKLGHFHLNSLLVKKQVLQVTPLMRTDLEISQDMEWITRLAYHLQLKNLPLNGFIASRRVHIENRISNQEKRIIYSPIAAKYRMDYFKDLPLSSNQKKLLSDSYFSAQANLWNYKEQEITIFNKIKWVITNWKQYHQLISLEQIASWLKYILINS